MEKFILKISTLACVILLNSCGGSSDDADFIPIDKNIQVSGIFSEYSSNKIIGTGTLRFLTTIPVLTSRSLYLKGTLDELITSSISAIFYSPNSAVPSSEGIVVKFSRSGINVSIEISVNNQSVSVTSPKISFYIPTSLDVIIDVHNINNRTRVLIWRKDTLDYAVASADVDTDRTGDINQNLPAQAGAGGFVGLILENATVSSARVDSPTIQD